VRVVQASGETGPPGPPGPSVETGASAKPRALENGREPDTGWERWERVSRRTLQEKRRSVTYPAIWMIRLFQRFVSPVDGPSCDFTPSCSSYGLQAVRKHGLFLGVPMAAERIVRNHRPDNLLRYPLVEREGGMYYLDPVESNDFWWATGP